MKKLRIIVLILCACIILTGLKTEVAVAANEAKATTFRLEKIEGEARVINSSGKSMSLTDGMQLYSGDTIQTDEKSYAYVSLDGSKLIKLEELSQAVIKKSGKKLEIKLEEGALYFEVNAKLADDESMTVGTSNISLSIRGTAGVVRKRNVEDSIHDTVWLLDGQVELTGIGAAAGRAPVTIWGGERVDYIENSGDWKRDLINIMEIPGFADVAMRQNTALLNAVYQLSGLDTEWIATNADARLVQDQEQNKQKYGNIFVKKQEAAPAPKPNVQQVTPTSEPDVQQMAVATTEPNNTQTTVPESNLSNDGNSGSENGDFDSGNSDNGVTGGGNSGEGTSQPEQIPSQTPAPTAEPEEEPTALPTATPTAMPTETPASTPTAIPVATPTSVPEEGPTATPASTWVMINFWYRPDYPNGDTVQFWEHSVSIKEGQTIYDVDYLPPEEPSVEGYRFTGWSTEDDENFYANFVEAETEAAPSPTPTEVPMLECKVVFMDWDGTTVLSEQYVMYGQAAVPPAEPSREGYRFAGWSTSDYTCVVNDMIVIACYEDLEVSPTPTSEPAVNTYEVTFLDYDGSVVNTQVVEEGQLPNEVSMFRTGYTFIGWAPEITPITEKTIFTAQYEPISNG